MLEPTDQDIAEALRAEGFINVSEEMRQYVAAHTRLYPTVLAHARTIAKLRIATEAAETLRKEAFLLLQNSEGCAKNHYGHDCNLYGMPQWLTDSRERITGATSTLNQIKEAGNG